jgi:hypothetical protein
LRGPGWRCRNNRLPHIAHRSPIRACARSLVPVLKALKGFISTCYGRLPDGYEPASVMAISSSLARACLRVRASDATRPSAPKSPPIGPISRAYARSLHEFQGIADHRGTGCALAVVSRPPSWREPARFEASSLPQKYPIIIKQYPDEGASELMSRRPGACFGCARMSRRRGWARGCTGRREGGEITSARRLRWRAGRENYQRRGGSLSTRPFDFALVKVGFGSETAVPARRRRDRSASISGPPAETALQVTARR